jgi:glycosyltransferase involved in cell wall biosynthesis
MKAFADQIAFGLQSRGHIVRQLTAPIFFGRFVPRKHPLTKWFGYIDQFLIFPPYLWFVVRFVFHDFLTVLSDQALGPWLLALHGRPNLVHCHDFLALEAAQGAQPYHHLTYSGKIYQQFIKKGFQHGRCFISVSSATRQCLEKYLLASPLLSTVVYNPLSPRFTPLSTDESYRLVSSALPLDPSSGFILHIGRNWYKNRAGLLLIWEHLFNLGITLPLVLVGSLDLPLQEWLHKRPLLLPHIHILDHPEDDLVVALYSAASCLLFPSHCEGFGWPILEALACGCPVVTTNRAPMTEVGSDVVSYIPPTPGPTQSIHQWACQSALVVCDLLNRTPLEKLSMREIGISHALRFDFGSWVDQLEQTYLQAIDLQYSV